MGNLLPASNRMRYCFAYALHLCVFLFLYATGSYGNGFFLYPSQHHYFEYSSLISSIFMIYLHFKHHLFVGVLANNVRVTFLNLV